jgi:hypothetical protein
MVMGSVLYQAAAPSPLTIFGSARTVTRFCRGATGAEEYAGVKRYPIRLRYSYFVMAEPSHDKISAGVFEQTCSDNALM